MFIVPHSFGRSYFVPIPKGNCSRAKSVTADDFRAISSCPVISKVFELGVLDRLKKFLSSSNNQFGFKKKPQLQLCYISIVTAKKKAIATRQRWCAELHKIGFC